MTGAWQARSGTAELPPRWAFGPWMSSNNWDNQALTLREAQKTVDLDLPATVLVLEQWSDEATFYAFNDAVYEPKTGGESFMLGDFQFPEQGRWPDPKAMIQKLHDQGLKVLLWQAPVMKYMDGLPHTQRDNDEAYMLEKGFAVKKPDGTPYRIPDFEWFKRSLVPDFDNAAAAEWWFAKRRYWFTELGIDGVKSDGGEGVYGDNAQRNRYPAVYVGAFHRFVQQETGGNGLTFSRAGFVGAHTVPAHWAGDERSTFEAFRASIRAGLSAGFSGLPFWGFDLGGFNGDIPTAELFLRSAAMAAFCPIMQYHAESKGEKNRDRTPWNLAERTGDPRVLPLYRFFAHARMNLLPYLWDEARACVVDGTPLMRALAFEFPGDENVRHVDDEYLLGRALLVAPVVHEGVASRSVVFPAGTWIGLFDRSRVEGPTVRDVVAPLEVLPVWVRAGSLVALNLGDSGRFPSSVGHQTDAYSRLTLLVVLDEPVVALYESWDGREIGVNLRLASGNLRGSVNNATRLPVTLWLDCPGKDREVVELLPGTRQW